MMNDLQLAKVRNDTAVGKAMAMGANPDLVQNALSSGQYSAHYQSLAD